MLVRQESITNELSLWKKNSMQDIAELQITKYKRGTHPHDDGEVLCSYIIEAKKEEKSLKALKRLTKYIESNDNNLFTFTRSETYQLRKFKTDGAFNEKGETVFSKEIKGNKELHSKALRRLAKWLSKKDNKYFFVAVIPFVTQGENCYLISSRKTKMLNKEDKYKTIKRKIVGQKGAITRNINKAKKIKHEYKTTLFPDSYKDNKRFKSLVKYLYVQKSRMYELTHMQLDGIKTIVGGYNPSSVFKV